MIRTPASAVGFALAIALVLFRSASTTFGVVLYDSNGFTGGGRFVSDASLEGQDLSTGGPWQITSNPNPAQATIRPAVGVGGGQGVQVSTAPNQTNTQWYISKPVAPAAPLDTVVIDWSMNVVPISISGLAFGPFFGVELYDASGTTPKQIGGFGVDASTGDLLVLLSGTSGTQYNTLLAPTAVPLGSYQNYRLSVDYTAKTYSVYYNGTLLETDPFVDASAAAFTDAPITTRFISNAGEQSLSAGTAYFDDYSVHVVPEPAVLPATLLGLVGGLRRRK